MTGVLAFIAFVSLLSLLFASVVAMRNNGLNTTYRRLADQFHGHVEQPGFWTWPTARISHRDVSATVTVKGLSVRATQVQVWQREFINSGSDAASPLTAMGPAGFNVRPELAFNCEIAPATLWERTTYLLGGRQGISESSKFNLQYAISTDHPENARRLLTRYVQLQIDRLRNFQQANDVYVRFCNGALTVRRRGVIRNERVLRQFVALAMELYEQAIASYGLGIDFLRVDGGHALEAVCKVCGDPLAGGDVVYCRVCDTPHHRDCWRYFGRCSVYACGERHFTHAPRLIREKA